MQKSSVIRLASENYVNRGVRVESPDSLDAKS